MEDQQRILHILKQRIDELTDEIEERTETIMKNTRLINFMVRVRNEYIGGVSNNHNMNLGDDFFDNLDGHIAENNTLLKENKDALEHQARLVKKYKQKTEQAEEFGEFSTPATQSQLDKHEEKREENHKENAKEEKSLELGELTNKEIYELTRDGEIPYNDSHPLIDNELFLMRILLHFEKEERFEECAVVHKRLKKLEQEHA